MTLYLFERQKESVPEYVFTYAENQTADYPTTLGALKFAELVEERSQDGSGYWYRQKGAGLRRM